MIKEEYRQLQKQWREANKEYIKQYRAQYRRENRDKIREYNRKYRMDHPGSRKQPNWGPKQSAKQLVNRAVRSGSLIRPNECSKCKRVCKPHAHHADYSKPLEVMWVCALCHSEIHVSLRKFIDPTSQ